MAREIIFHLFTFTFTFSFPTNFSHNLQILSKRTHTYNTKQQNNNMFFHSYALPVSISMPTLEMEEAPTSTITVRRRPTKRPRYTTLIHHRPNVEEFLSANLDSFGLLGSRSPSTSSIFFDDEFDNMKRRLMMARPTSRSQLLSRDTYDELDKEFTNGSDNSIIRKEDDKSYTFQLNVPENMSSDDMKLKIHHQGDRHYLSLNGVVEKSTHKNGDKDGDGNMFTSRTTFSSKVLLPEDVDVDSIKAEYLSLSSSPTVQDNKNNSIGQCLMVKVSKVGGKGNSEEEDVGKLIEIGEKKESNDEESEVKADAIVVSDKTKEKGNEEREESKKQVEKKRSLTV